MTRSWLPGASRGLGRAKPHLEIHRGQWLALNVVRADGRNHPFIGAEVVDVVGHGPTPAHAFTEWFNAKHGKL